MYMSNSVSPKLENDYIMGIQTGSIQMHECESFRAVRGSLGTEPQTSTTNTGSILQLDERQITSNSDSLRKLKNDVIMESRGIFTRSPAVGNMVPMFFSCLCTNPMHTEFYMVMNLMRLKWH